MRPMAKEANTVWFGRLTDKPICKGPLGAIRWFSLAQRPGVEEMVTVTNAVVFVQQDRFEVNAARCLDYCAVRRATASARTARQIASRSGSMSPAISVRLLRLPACR